MSEPITYMFETPNGWQRASQSLTDEINERLRRHEIVETAGYSLYPQFAPPSNPSERKVAWRITKDGYRVVRNRLISKEFNRTHSAPLYLKYDSATKFWVLDKGATN